MIERAIAGEDIEANSFVYYGADGKVYNMPPLKVTIEEIRSGYHKSGWPMIDNPIRYYMTNYFAEKFLAADDADTPTIVDAPR